MVYFLKRVNNYADAEDLTQEAFARLVAHPDRGDGTALSSYVFTIAANLLRDRARMRVARLMDAQEPIDNPQPPANLIEDIHPERVLLGKEALKDVVSALEELGAQTRDIFIMSRLEKIPQREIAALYGVSVSAIEKHMIRATAVIGARLKR
jgi:RNA polymerase sigma-70 factor (ECF subfamily)